MIKRQTVFVVSIFLVVLLSITGCNSSSKEQIILESGPRIGMINSTEAVIAWDTVSPYQGTLIYKEAGESEFTGKVLSSKITRRHSVLITNLKPATVYEFQIEGYPITGSFKTAAPDITQFVFVSMADNRGQSDKDDVKGLPQSFINIISDAVKRKPVFAVNVGDLFYGKNPDIDIFRQLYQSFKKAIHPLAFKTSYLISPGNHEMSPFLHNNDKPGFDPVALFNEEFPQPGPLKGYEGFVFSWDYGKVHFVSIATNHFDASVTNPKHAMYFVSDAQIAWLDTDLQQARLKGGQFIIVFGHSNAYLGTGPKWDDSSSDLGDLNNTDPKQRDKFWDVLAKHNTDIYVCGHRHFSDDSVTVKGVVQWMNGNSGSVVGGPNQYTVWTVNGNTIKADLVDDTGNTNYSRVFKK